MRGVLLFWLFGWLALQGAEVTTELSTDVVEAGHGAMLTLRIEGGDADQAPQIPEVKDLVVNPRGRSQTMQIVNGTVSRAMVYSYIVGAHVPGEYDIPSFPVRVGGKVFQTDRLHLKVRPSSSGEPGGMGDEEKVPGEESDFGHLTFQMVEKDRKHVYPGEIAPVRIQAYFPVGVRVSLGGQPRPEGGAFTLQNLSEQPRQEIKNLEGKDYRVLTWYAGLSATKAGTYPAGLSLDCTVAVPDRSAQKGLPGFEDPFFGRSPFDDLFTPMVQKDVTLKTPEPPELEVLELPKEGRPENFSGAIGTFEFESVQIPETMETGEPTRVRARIKGSGNFTLLKQPEPLPADEWKTYEGQEDFSPGDAASFEGTKEFSFNVVPMRPGAKDVRLGLTYFDPDLGAYQVLESDGQKVAITGTVILDEGEQKDGGNERPPLPDGPELAPVRETLGRVGRYEPWPVERVTTTVVGCGSLALALLGWGIWKQREVDPRRLAWLAVRAAEASALAAAEEAVRRGDVPGFFRAAREALQCRLAEFREVRPESLTLTDLEGRVEERCLELWRTGDRMEYSGEVASAGSLEEWREVLHEGLKRLSEASTRA
ncbi:hypothetical protein HNR46_001508 [Haloferula luteola]|uniref:Oxygen tolerance n=1 Tax=Haloferula luteola TaxID=595692 RepID=A0A840UZS8_9BACT|nr:BatD family protein [Haloferula luteola]MBB5351272.1 hypothetical protein [Haloferula luteola]